MKKYFSNERSVTPYGRPRPAPRCSTCGCKLGVTEQTFSRWKRKFAGLGVAELARLRQLEEELKLLKSLVADLTLDKHKLQEVLGKKF
jgi:hypothetical protein